MACIKWLKCFNIFANAVNISVKWCGWAIAVMILSGCVSEILTSANIIYDRHHFYMKFNDFTLAANSNRALFGDQRFKCDLCAIEIAVFNQDVLMVGHVPSLALRREAESRIRAVSGKRRFYNELNLYSGIDDDPVLDGWITAKIRSEILADSTIDPNKFKIVTADQIVYLMGDVDAEQAKKVILFARDCTGVKRVVKLMQYYQLTNPGVSQPNRDASQETLQRIN